MKWQSRRANARIREWLREALLAGFKRLVAQVLTVEMKQVEHEVRERCIRPPVLKCLEAGHAAGQQGRHQGRELMGQGSERSAGRADVVGTLAGGNDGIIITQGVGADAHRWAGTFRAGRALKTEPPADQHTGFSADGPPASVAAGRSERLPRTIPAPQSRFRGPPRIGSGRRSSVRPTCG